MDLSFALTIATESAQTAGGLLRQGLMAEKTVRNKSSEVDLVTEYDEAAEKLIVAGIQEAFPEHLLITEEGSVLTENQAPSAGKSSYTWYIDPLDGTNNFAHGYPVFAVSIALYRQNQPLLGVVYDPTRDECFQAISGRGAYLSKNGDRIKLQVSGASRLVEGLLATGFPYDRHHSEIDNVSQLSAFLKKARGIRRSGSAALDLASVAAGRFDGFWEFRLSSWDVAAGACLVQEAGGQISNVDGRPWTIAPYNSLIASNGRIHAAMEAVLKDKI
jgi:myo-inositol-1(or 4)-monophosphatase